MLSLAKQEKAYLLQIARTTIEDQLKGRNFPLPVPKQKSLHQAAGAFVSLHRGEELRGCIGRIGSVDPLFRVVHEMALAAAFQDARFDPISLKEWTDLVIEVSVLSPLQKISTISEIEVGKHGLWVASNGQHGVLLPQVAAEEGWDAETFLSFTCMKAGLPFDFWRGEKLSMEVFSAEVFSEKSL